MKNTDSAAAAAAEQRAAGRLILVTCPDMGRLDLVVRAAVRRLEAGRGVVLAEPVATHALPAGSGMIVNKRTLAVFEASGALCLTWCKEGRTFGYTTGLLDLLATGNVVVATGPRECEIAARRLWRDVRIVRIEHGTEGLRRLLSPQSLHARLLAGAPTEARLARVLAESCDVRVSDLAGISGVVRELTEVVTMLLPPPPSRARVPLAELAAPPVRQAGVLGTRRMLARPRGRRLAAKVALEDMRAMELQGRPAAST